MSKILSASILSVPEVIIVNDNINDLTVVVEIEFHDLDLTLKMEYYLHVFVYDIHGEVDAPLILPNWDESKLVPISLDRKDEYLGVSSQKVLAINKRETIQLPMQLKLGKLTKLSSHFTKKLEVFATMTPAIGQASKWSEPFESRIEL
tara:strand:+ start:3443 stop:3886 length:444 start_codon:yes stop_codon:yes gene_type:complete